jgi:hypothetical protein
VTQAIDSVTQSLPIPDETKQAVSDKARVVQSQVGNQVTSQIGARASQAGQQVGAVSTALHTTTDQLRQQGQEGTARIVEQAAAKGDELSSYLANSDPSQILSDVEDFCRQQPWVAVACGVALGLLGARFLKSSSSRRYESRYGARTSAGYSPRTGYSAATGYSSGTAYSASTGYTSRSYDTDAYDRANDERIENGRADAQGFEDDPLRAGTDV